MGAALPPLPPDLSAPPRARVANGPIGSLTSATPDRDGGEEMGARHAAIEKILALFCAAYDREPPDAVERKVKVGVWAIALSRVPVAELLPLAKRELAERESSFFPVPADLLRRWQSQSRSRLTPDGAANAAAYLPYSPARRPALPEPLPPLQIEPEELKRRLGTRAPSRAQSSTPAESEGEVWDAVLLDVAQGGNIALERCSPTQIAELRAFGRWWLANHPALELSLANFAGTYAVFSADRTDKLNTENTEEHKKHKEKEEG